MFVSSEHILFSFFLFPSLSDLKQWLPHKCIKGCAFAKWCEPYKHYSRLCEFFYIYWSKLPDLNQIWKKNYKAGENMWIAPSIYNIYLGVLWIDWLFWFFLMLRRSLKGAPFISDWMSDFELLLLLLLLLFGALWHISRPSCVHYIPLNS